MAKFSFSDATILFGAVDISGNTNEVSLEANAVELNTTNFTSNGWRELILGLRNGNATCGGFLEDAAEPDAAFFTSMTTGVPVTFTVTNPAAIEDRAYALKTETTRYSPRLPVGELYGYNLSIAGASPLVRGQILDTGTFTGNGSSTGFQFGAIGATQSMYAALHVTAVSATGDTADIVIESDDNSGFTSATTRFTFTQVTSAGGVTSQWMTPLAGAVTDDYWRVTRTIAGSSPSFTYTVFIGLV